MIGGWVLLVFTSHQLRAQSPYAGYPQENSYQEACPQEGYPVDAYGYGEAAPTGMDQIREYPHPGPQWAATHGYPNYDLPDWHFGVWFRSQAWGLTKRERRAIPDPWRPRGLGNLFARPSTTHRMDYNRPYLTHPHTEYGPSYYLRQPDQRVCVRDFDGKRVYRESRRMERQLDEQLIQDR